MRAKTKKTRRSLKIAAPPKYAALKKIALSLPGAEEVWFHGHPWFNIGSKSFALFWQGRWIFKLPKPQQMMLFDTRPDTFTPMRAGRMVWSFVAVEDLDNTREVASSAELRGAAHRSVSARLIPIGGGTCGNEFFAGYGAARVSRGFRVSWMGHVPGQTTSGDRSRSSVGRVETVDLPGEIRQALRDAFLLRCPSGSSRYRRD